MKLLKRTNYYTYKEKPVWLLFFVIGAVLGIIMVLFHRDVFLYDTYFFSEDVLKRFSYSSIYKEPFFFYVLKNRMSTLAFLILASVTVLGGLCLYLFCVWFGMSMGVIFTTLVIRYGRKGFWVFAGLFLPQDMIYIPAFLILGNCLYGIYRRMSRRRSMNTDGHEDDKTFYLKHIIVIMLMIIVFFIGCILESYVNPILLKKILKIF